MAPFDPPPPPEIPDRSPPPFRVPLKLRLWTCFKLYLICQAHGLVFGLFYVVSGYFTHGGQHWQGERFRRETMFVGALIFAFWGALGIVAAGWGYFKIRSIERRYRLSTSR